jgi:hypothetical protein
MIAAADDALVVEGLKVSGLTFRVSGQIKMHPGDDVHRRFMEGLLLGRMAELTCYVTVSGKSLKLVEDGDGNQSVLVTTIATLDSVDEG